METAETFLKSGATQRAGAIGIVLDYRRLKHFLEGNRHALGDGSNALHDRHIWIIPALIFWISGAAVSASQLLCPRTAFPGCSLPGDARQHRRHSSLASSTR